MLLKALQVSFSTQMNYVTQMINPLGQSPYYPSFNYGQVLEVKELKQIEILLSETLKVLSDPQDNLNSFKKRLKIMKPSQFNIVSDGGIEWGLKEKLLSTVQFMDTSNLSFQTTVDQSHQQILQSGYLEIYGVSPYRHLNKWMHEYDYQINEMQIRFQERQNEDVSVVKTETEGIKESLQNTIQEEQKKTEGIAVKTKRAFFKFNSLFRSKDQVQEQSKLQHLKDVIKNSVKTKESHILVRDYEIQTNSQLFLRRRDSGKILQGEEWVDDPIIQKNTFYLRTETLIDPKESLSLKLHKSIVVTDFNWVMRGNPWAWINRFDLQQ